MTLKEKIVKFSAEHPGCEYRDIASSVGCSLGTAYYHLNPDYAERHGNHARKRRSDYQRILQVEKGGKCLICGYSKCSFALEFHHLDPSTKGEAVLKSRSLEIARKEMEGCVLLCANCHREFHAGMIELPTGAP